VAHVGQQGVALLGELAALDAGRCLERAGRRRFTIPGPGRQALVSPRAVVGLLRTVVATLVDGGRVGCGVGGRRGGALVGEEGLTLEGELAGGAHPGPAYGQIGPASSGQLPTALRQPRRNPPSSA